MNIGIRKGKKRKKLIELEKKIKRRTKSELIK